MLLGSSYLCRLAWLRFQALCLQLISQVKLLSLVTGYALRLAPQLCVACLLWCHSYIVREFFYVFLITFLLLLCDNLELLLVAGYFFFSKEVKAYLQELQSIVELNNSYAQVNVVHFELLLGTQSNQGKLEDLIIWESISDNRSPELLGSNTYASAIVAK